MQLLADNLACDRGGRNVFSNLSFSLPSGGALVVTGHNGAGKSSLLRAIAGLVRLSAGTLKLAGGANDLTIAEQTHYLGHADALKAPLSVRENLEFWSGYLGGTAVARALDAVGLSGLAGLPAGFLSAGQRRRLSIARLVAVTRPLWLLDEPTTALDAGGERQLVAIMNAHLKGGGMIVAASHGAIGLKRARKLRLGP